MLIEKFPDGVKQKDSELNIPLCLAINVVKKRATSSETLVLHLIDIFPDGAMNKNKKGLLPLHLAAIHKASLNIISALIENFPDGTNEKDANGLIPVDHAVKCEANAEIVSALIQFIVGKTGGADGCYLKSSKYEKIDPNHPLHNTLHLS